MSKASEWAKAAHAISALDPGRFEVAYVKSPDYNREFTFHAGVGRSNDQPTMCMTDYRTGSVVLSDHQARIFARWILDTFGEGTP